MVSRQKYRDVAARFVYGEERFVDAIIAWVDHAELPEVADDKIAQCVKLSALLEVAVTHQKIFDEERHKELSAEVARDQVARIADEKDECGDYAQRLLAAKCLWGIGAYSAQQTNWIENGIDALEKEYWWAWEFALAERVAKYLLVAEGIGFFDRRCYDIIENGLVVGSAEDRLRQVEEAVGGGLLREEVTKAVKGLVDDNNRAMVAKNVEIAALHDELETLKRRYER